MSHLAICGDRRLLGIVRIETLLPAPADGTARALMDPDPPVVSPGLDQEKAAWLAVRHRESALAVLDENGLFAGLVPPQRLLEVLLWEHDEDISRLGGVLHRQSLAQASQDESMLRRLAHRLPWLLVGLAGAILAARRVDRDGPDALPLVPQDRLWGNDVDSAKRFGEKRVRIRWRPPE